MDKKNKQKVILFRCTEEEAKIILEEAKKFKSVSDYLRRRVFKHGASLINPVDLIRVLDEQSREMKYIGNNINQFAKYANQRGQIANDEIQKEFNTVFKSYVNIAEKILSAYRKIISL